MLPSTAHVLSRLGARAASTAPRSAPRRTPKHAARAESLARAMADAGASTSGGGGGEGADALPTLDVASLGLPPPRDVRVKTARYITSSVDPKGCPPPNLPEFAFIGRSNVGKSSLINALTGTPGLAQVSKTPGKTRCINHFLINDAWYLVDLPGYGYAKQSRTDRDAWAAFTQAYFVDRPSLACAFLLADGSVPPQPADVEAAAWLAEAGVPFGVVLTKADKRKKGAPPPEENVAALKAAFLTQLETLPPMWATSSVTGTGRKELLAYMSQLRQVVEAALKAERSAKGGGGKGGAPDDVPDDEWY